MLNFSLTFRPFLTLDPEQPGCLLKKRVYFSRKKLLLINLNAVFPLKICFNFSYEILLKNVGIRHASRLCSFIYIPLTSKKGKFQPQINIFGKRPAVV